MGFLPQITALSRYFLGRNSLLMEPAASCGDGVWVGGRGWGRRGDPGVKEWGSATCYKHPLLGLYQLSLCLSVSSTDSKTVSYQRPIVLSSSECLEFKNGALQGHSVLETYPVLFFDLISSIRHASK